MFENKYETDNTPWETEEEKKDKSKLLKLLLLCAGGVVLLLVVFIFFSLVTLISSTPSTEHVPQVASIEQLDSYPISNCEIEEEVMKVNYEDRLETDFSSIGYKYKVTLDNGKEIILSPGSRNYDIGSSKAFLELNGYIWTNDLGEIIRSNDSTVDVTVSAKIRNAKDRYNSIISETEVSFKNSYSCSSTAICSCIFLIRNSLHCIGSLIWFSRTSFFNFSMIASVAFTPTSAITRSSSNSS